MAEFKRLTEAVEDYGRQRQSRGMAANTVNNEMFVLRRFAAWYGDVQMRHMKPDKVSDWFYGTDGLRSTHKTRDGLVRSAIAPSTANYYKTRLKSFFEFASKRGWIRIDLLDEVDTLRLPTVLRQRPGPDVLNAMIDSATSDRDRSLLTLLMHTGLRMSEVLRLRVGNVDMTALNLFVYVSKSDLEDQMPMTAGLGRELRRWMLTYASQIGRPLTTEDYLFPVRQVRMLYRTEPDGAKVQYRAPDTWRADTPMTHAERVVKAALVAVGLPSKGEGCHTLRRAAARALFDELTADSGYDSALRIVSAWLHHKSSQTTERYLGLAVERLQRDQFMRGREFLAPTQQAIVLPLPVAHRA